MAVQNMPAVSIDINMFWQIINFLILLFCFKKYFQKPIAKILEDRKEKIANELSEATKDKELAAKAIKESEDLLKETKNKAHTILTEAEKKAEDRKESILHEAKTNREKTIKSAEVEIAKMKAAARKDLQSEVTELAVKLSEKIIKKELSAKDNADLLDEFITEVGSEGDVK